jgi:hypothetical protein
VAVLQPVSAGSGAIAADSEFTLRSLDGRPVDALAAALQSEPAISFRVVSADGDTAVLRPEGGLEPGTTYRINLARSDGTTEAAWIAQVASPLRVTDSVPGNAATRVPVDTGIEVTFDQYGVKVTDFADHFAIEPSVDGRFESLGRTFVFVPDHPLAKGRLYTVTIGHGLPLPGTEQTLEHDVVIRFETRAKAASPIAAWFLHPLVETSTTDKARITMAFDVPDGRSAPRSIPITIHHVVGIDAAVAAWRAIASAPEWTRVSPAAAVPTEGLDRVFAGNVRVKKLDDYGTRWLTVPVRLPAGWYVVTERYGGIPRQVMLQVSDLATFAMVAADRTATWVNDLRTGSTVTGATVTLAGQPLGRTDDRGLLVAATPAAVAQGDGAEEALLVVRHAGQTTFRGTGMGGADPDASTIYGAGGNEGWYDDGWRYGGLGSANDSWWRLLYTDRAMYRSTDSINAWGMLRGRDGGRVPTSVTLELRGDAWAGEWSEQPTASPVIVNTTVRPDAVGAFVASLPIRDLPDASYSLRLVAEGETIAEQWLEVGPIAKPAWRLELTADRRAVISGARVKAMVRADFYDGTPVAVADIELDSYVYDDVFDGGDETRLQTDAFGRAQHAIVLVGGSSCQPCTADISANPVVPEEADFYSSTSVDVFAAAAIVDAAGTLAGTRLRVTGMVRDVMLSRYEQAAPGEEVDPRGAARAGARVSVHVVEHWTVERQVGTRYDAVEKKVVPKYKTDYRQRVVADRGVTTKNDGTFSLGLDVVGGRRSYEISASYIDEKGRMTMTSTLANEPETSEEDWSGPALVNADANSYEDLYSADYAVGSAVRVRFVSDVANPSVERYLYAIAQAGIRYVTVGSTPTFRTTFEASSLPGIWITGVRFNGRGYETAVSNYLASADLESRRLTVDVTPDRDRYAPGDTAALTIRTLGPDGDPVSASVYVQAIDEKLYAMDAAWDPDPLGELYGTVDDGMLSVVASHRPAEDDAIEGMDTMGGGGDERSDLRDWLISTLVTTDRSGRATVTVPLSDDLTSWRVIASALDGSLCAGLGSGRITVGLPFFVEATLKDEYLAADRPIIRVRGFGTGLAESDRVTFTVSSDTLPMSAVTVKARAYAFAEVPLPALSPGVHRLRIRATVNGSDRADTLVRTFRVVESRAVRRSTTWRPLETATAAEAGTGRSFTYLTLTDAGRGRVIPLLYELLDPESARADANLAASLAARVLTRVFGLDATASADETGLWQFERPKGLALVAHGSAQLDVTALAALTGDPRLQASDLQAALDAIAFDPDQRRERRLMALAGLAGLGQPVLTEIRAAAAMTDLTLAEQVSLALAALYAGDEALAGRLEQRVLRDHGLARGPWLRLDAGYPEEDAVQTARLAIVSASLGRSFATDMDAWLAANPTQSTLVDLERALAARGWAQRTPGATAVAATWVDGNHQELVIQPGSPVSLALTPSQAATARIEPVSGSVVVVTQRDVPLDPTALTAPEGVSISRSVLPDTVIGSTDTMVVSLRVTLPKAARNEAWTVVDWVPSGLRPTEGGESDAWATRQMITPDSVTGQRVVFRFGEDSKTVTWVLRYVARVVTPGTYRWEPAVLQSDVAPDEGIVLPSSEVVIAGLSAPITSPATPRPRPSPTPTRSQEIPPTPSPARADSPTPASTAAPTALPTPPPTPDATPTAPPASPPTPVPS